MIEVRTYLLFPFAQYRLAIETSFISHISAAYSKDKDAGIYTLHPLFNKEISLDSPENQKLIHLKTGEIIQTDNPEDIIEVPLHLIFPLPESIMTMRKSQAVCSLLMLQDETLITSVDPTILIQESSSPKEAV